MTLRQGMYSMLVLLEYLNPVALFILAKGWGCFPFLIQYSHNNKYTFWDSSGTR
jgi:hypothetical protein